ncbi:MAG: hypothetical protein JWP87_5755 [Labilithrix sp.]|nr:hypothetical protein [Labilithrix sp.]
MKRRVLIGVLAVGAASVSCNAGSDTAPTSEPSAADKLVVADPEAGGCVDCADYAVDNTELLTDEGYPDLIDPTGLAFDEDGAAWIGMGGMGRAIVVDPYNNVGSTVGFPGYGYGEGYDGYGDYGGYGWPTSVVYNTSTDAFLGDPFMFVNGDGSIYGWGGRGGYATRRVERSRRRAFYGGSALYGNRLYRTDFLNGGIDVFGGPYGRFGLGEGAFVDPYLPYGYSPYNIMPYRDSFFVTYALRDENGEVVPGEGNGLIDVYDENGNYVSRLATGGPLDAPYGLAITPDDYGDIPGRLLVGNYGDGRINVYDLDRGDFGWRGRHRGWFGDGRGRPWDVDGLWGIGFGRGRGRDRHDLFYTGRPHRFHGRHGHGRFGRFHPRWGGRGGHWGGRW